VNVQTEALERPKPHDESECHKHSCTDEMLHKVPTAKGVSGIYIDTYRVPIRVVCFWVLMGIAVAWFLVAAYKFGRHGS
jgi:hypothetical protein